MTTRGTMALVCLCALSACLAAMTQTPSGRQPVVQSDRLQAFDVRSDRLQPSDVRSGRFQPVEGEPEPAEAGPYKPVPQPARLPTARLAAPIVADAGPVTALRELIRREMPHASPADIDVWMRKFRGMPLSDARNMLELRRLVPIRPGRGEPRPFTSQPIPAPTSPTVVAPNQPRLTPVPVAGPSPLDPSLVALRQARDVTLNNIANAKTPGFKRGRPVFADVPQSEPTAFTRPGEPASLLAIGGGVRVVSVQRDWSQGKIVKTGRMLDCAIKGRGFFVIRRGTQRAFTRNGNFERNAAGQLVLATDRSWRVETTSEPRDLKKSLGSATDKPKNKLTLTVAVRTTPAKPQPGRRQFEVPLLPGGLAPLASLGMDVKIQRNARPTPRKSALELVSAVQFATFANPDGLQSLGSGQFAATQASGPAIIEDESWNPVGKIGIGHLESSNVDVNRELAELRDIAGQMRAIRMAEAVLMDAESPSPARGPVVEKPGSRRMSDSRERKSEVAPDDGWFDRMFHSAKYREINRSLNYVDDSSKTPKVEPGRTPSRMAPPRKLRRIPAPATPANFEQLDSLEYPIEIEILFWRNPAAGRITG